MKKTVFLTTFALTAMTFSLAHAQDPFGTAGYTPFNRPTAAPNVALPTSQIRQSPPSVITSPVAPNAEAAVQNTSNASNYKPNGAIDTSQRSSRDIDRSARAAQTAVGASVSGNKYVPGMLLTGKAHVYDGHSFSLDGHAVRLNGVEAPGIAQQCKTASMTSWSCGKRAFDRLYSLVEGQKVSCVVTEVIGHGVAARCSTLGIKDVASLIVSEGWAIPNPVGYREYGANSLSARNQSRGLWVGTFENPLVWRENNR